MPPRAKVHKDQLPVERWPLHKLVPDPANARLHSQRNIDAIRGSLRRFGQRKPLVVDKDGVLVAGSGTLEAMQAEEFTEAWVTVFPGTAAEARAYGIADNRTGELAHWDGEVLLSTLRGLPDDLMAAAGYDAEDLADFIDRFGPAPGLDDLGDNVGDPVASALWPTLRITMPKALLERYNTLAATVEADSDAERFEQLLLWAEAGASAKARK